MEVEMEPSDDDLREIFALFTSCTKQERGQVYDVRNEHYFLNVDLSEEYELTEPKKEYALDAWRAVLFFLSRRGFSLSKGGETIVLDWIEDEFMC
jgi:hypothetical protein